jgi:hypothetical protein
LPSYYTNRIVPSSPDTPLRLQDMYVDFNLAQDTAAKFAGLRRWMTNEFQTRACAMTAPSTRIL